MHEKLCKKCEAIKPTSEFYLCKNKVSKYQSYCKQCMVDINKEKYRTNPKKTRDRTKVRECESYKLLNELKEYYGCNLCDESCPCCLDFHHIDNSTKDANIAGLIARHSIKALVAEIKKCILVCSNCHRKIHNHHVELIVTNVSYDKFDELLLYTKRTRILPL